MADAVTRHVVTFGRVLREAGLEVGPGRLVDALTGLDLVDLSRRDDVYWTLRSTFVTRRDEIDVFDDDDAVVIPLADPLVDAEFDGAK